MPAPRPLTQCDPPQLDWSRPGTPAATDFGDIYFSVDGGLDETRAVYLQGCGLAERWQDRRVFTIGELGFGSGLNFLAAWRLWEAAKSKNGRLHFVSIEKFPFDAAQLEQSFSAWPELAVYSKQLIRQWPGRVRGFHRLHFGDVTLTLIHDDVAAALDSLTMQADAWFLDGFSPSKNPDMWSESVLGRLTRLTAPGAKLATFTVAGAVRQALAKAGFAVSKQPGFGRKRDRLEAVFPGKTEMQKPLPRPLIIGAGIGGASLAQAFLRRGITPNIISRGMDKAASGNPAALIKPRLDLQDRPESRFFLSSYLYALQAYHSTEAVLHEGVTHLPKSDQDRVRFEKLATQAPLSKAHLDWVDNALSLPSSLTISPEKVREAWLKDAVIEQRAINSVDELPDDHLMIFAAGFGGRDLLKDYDLPMRYSRGQLTWAKADVTAPLTYGGYALPTAKGTLIGATHDRVQSDDPFICRVEDDYKNLSQFQAITGLTAAASDHPSRASVRVTTANTLPLIRNFEINKWVFTGLGSRGFVFAPLLAEALVSEILGEPRPIDRALWARFHQT